MAYHPLGPETPCGTEEEAALLAIDLGLRAGMALYSQRGACYTTVHKFWNGWADETGYPRALPRGVRQLVTG